MVVMYSVVSVDGFIADDNDDPGPLFEWYFNGDHALSGGEMDVAEEAIGAGYDPAPGGFGVSQASYDYVQPMWDSIGSMVIGRHVFDMTNGWEGKPPSGEHVIVVSHRAKPDGWHPEAPYDFVDGVTYAIAKATERAGDRAVVVAAGDVGGQALALGLVDEVAMDVVPVVFGSGKRYFGAVDRQHLLEDPDVVILGDRVLHLRYQVRHPGGTTS